MDKDKIDQFIKRTNNELDNFDDSMVGSTYRAEFYENVAIDCFNFIVDIRNSMEGDDD